MKEIREIRTDHIDDENVQHVDIWFSDDDNAEGKTVAVVCLDTLKTFYYDNDYRLNPRVREAIQEIVAENVQPPTEPSQTKTVHVCDFCGSDNVQTKAWVRPNENNEYVDLVSEEIQDNYCDDCDQNTMLNVIDKPRRAVVIGFQVWGDDGTAQDGEPHPHMKGSFCVYSLDQANSMMDDDNDGEEQWKLMTIWTDTIEEPTLMFKTDPR